MSEVVVAFWRHAKQHYRKNGRPTGTADNYKPALSLLKARYGHTLATDFGPLALNHLSEDAERIIHRYLPILMRRMV